MHEQDVTELRCIIIESLLKTVAVVSDVPHGDDWMKLTSEWIETYLQASWGKTQLNNV